MFTRLTHPLDTLYFALKQEIVKKVKQLSFEGGLLLRVL